MRVVIRTDASSEMGVGHARRCLSVARALAQNGVDAQFVVREHALDYDRLLGDGEFPIAVLPSGQQGGGGADIPHGRWAGVDAPIDVEQTLAAIAGVRPDWVLIDHYGFDARWHRAVAAATGARIAVIDDLADRRLDCDMVIDPNWHKGHSAKYRSVLDRPASILGGAKYALLDPIYLTRTPASPERPVASIGVFMGGADTPNATLAAIEALDLSGFEGPVEIVSTSVNAQLDSLAKAVAARRDTTLTVDLPNLADFYLRHALHVGAGGSATWERAYCGVAVIAAICADNQEHVLGPLEGLGVVKLHASRPINPHQMAQELDDLIRNPERRAALSRNASRLVDGKGSQRVATTMQSWL